MLSLRSLSGLCFALFSATSFASFENCKEFFPNKQVPLQAEAGRDLCFDTFAIMYSPSQKKPIYTIERLNKQILEGPRQERTNRFYEEARLPINERSTLNDYKYALKDDGFSVQRGHHVPAADQTTPNGMSQSFSLANVAPENPHHNEKVWSVVESSTRKYIKRSGDDVYVYTGSIGRLGTIGKSKVVVPSQFFKLVYDKTKNRAWAYLIPNTEEASVTPPISYAELVRATGIDFNIGNPGR